MLEALGAVVAAVILGLCVAVLILLHGAFRGLDALAAALPRALAAFILTAAAVLWGLHR